jgi:hypothetical protein
MPVAPSPFDKPDEGIRIQLRFVLNLDKPVHIQFAVADGSSGTERHAMAAKVAGVRAGMRDDFVVFFAEASDAPDGAYAACIAFFLVYRNPVH